MMTIHFAIGAIPLAVYFILIGALRLRKRPLVTTGWRDTLTIGIASVGLVAVGPMQLFFPGQAAARWHGWVWVALLVLYVLALMMILLSCKPRLIAYGMDEAQFYQTLLKAALQVDEQAHWNAEVLNLPGCGIQLAIEPSGSSRVQQAVHVGMLHNLHDWMLLERQFVRDGAAVTCPRSLAGWPLLISGCLLLATALFPMLADPNEALAQLREFVNR